MDWKNDFSVGIESIDIEHKNLVQCVSAIADARTAQELAAAMDRFLFCLRVHCSAEEGLMRTLNYPNADMHVKEHEDFLAGIRAVDAGIEGAPLPPETVTLLEKMLENHFTADERAYGVFYLSRSRKARGSRPSAGT